MVSKRDLLDAIQNLAIDQSIMANEIQRLEERVKKLETKPKYIMTCACEKGSAPFKSKDNSKRLEKAIKDVAPKRRLGRPLKIA